jgi:inorganic pyrophosphatase
MSISALQKLTPFFEHSILVNSVIDTPKAVSFKLKFDEHLGLFRVHKGMPLGFVFPFNFGYIPATRGEDGDALDVLVLSEHAFPVGTVALGKLIAVLEAVQIEGRLKQRNDRLIALPVEMVSRNPIQPTIEFNAVLKKSITGFFIKYNDLQGRTFRPLRYASAREAVRLVRKAHVAWQTDLGS